MIYFLRTCLLMLILNGCLYTTHHFNTGKILPPGKTSLTFGAGANTFLEENYIIELREIRVHDNPDSVFSYYAFIPDTSKNRFKKTYYPVGSMEYRLGVINNMSDTPLLEIGWHFEGPTNPVTMEFFANIALPEIVTWIQYHSLTAGWGLGFWADNSYFLEYAASKEMWKTRFYINYRLTLLATQLEDATKGMGEYIFEHNRRLINQISTGCLWKMPEIFLFPDQLIPQIIFTYPKIGVSIDGDNIPDKYINEKYSINFNLGMGWNF